jgi:hypothetical protein
MTVLQKCTYRVETSEEFKEKLRITDEELLPVVEEYTPDENTEEITIEEIRKTNWVIKIKEITKTPVQLMLIDVLRTREQDYVLTSTTTTLLITEIHDKKAKPVCLSLQCVAFPAMLTA